MSTTPQNGKSYLKEGLFLAGVAGLGAIGGFVLTVSRVKRRNPASFMKTAKSEVYEAKKAAEGMLATPEAEQLESGTSVGLRALGWGTFFAVTGVGTLTLGVCKLMGVRSMEEFKTKFQSVAPAIKRRDPAETEATREELHSAIFEESTDG